MGSLHDFDFLHGRWAVHHTKLRDVADPACAEWVEFGSTARITPVLGGGGQVDELVVPEPPDGPPFEGLTLRLYDPGADLWRIWWSSTRAPGRLDPPLEGRFVEDVGVFDGSDVLAGRPVDLRFEWRAGDAPTWQQSFSFDGGLTWAVTWRMRLERL